jgi:hypothetical protein
MLSIQRLWIKVKRLLSMSSEVIWSDPYAHWLPSADQSSGADSLPSRQPLQAFDGDLIPVVLQLSNLDEAQRWWKIIRKHQYGKVQRRPGMRHLSILAEKDKARELLELFQANNLRWEIGAPFSSTAAYTPLSGHESEEGTGEDEEKNVFQPIKSKKKKIIGIIDYGCAFANEKFCAVGKDRKTRVFAIWDQQSREANPTQPMDFQYKQLSWRPTTRYGYGFETFRESSEKEKITLGLNDFIAQFNHSINGFDDELCYQHANYEAIYNRHATHGTYIMDFAAGMPNPLKDAALETMNEWVTNDYGDMSETDIVFVQLPRIINGETVSGVLRTFVLDAIMYILRCAADDADVVINISYGGMAGPHNGGSVVEQAIDDLIHAERVVRQARKKARTEVVICAGNTRISDMHAIKTIQSGVTDVLRFEVIPDNPTLQFIEMWFDGESLSAEIDVLLPSGNSATQGEKISLNQGSVQSLFNDSGQILGQICAPKRQDESAQVLIGLNPSLICDSKLKTTPCTVGSWKIAVTNHSSSLVQWNAWCERSDPIFGSGHGPRQIKFIESTTSLATLNNLASGSKIVVAGGSVLNAAEFMAEYSSQGPKRGMQGTVPNDEIHIDPNIIYAPSEENLAYWALPGAGVLGQTKVRYSGTSVAAAVVSRQLIAGKSITQLSSYRKPTEIRTVFR